MVIKHVALDIVCGITSTLPKNEVPEIAFAGKSNVGKSSLINALMNRKALARTSASPGKTQTINFYNVNHEMYLVDLPGYGYAGYQPIIIATKADKLKRSQVAKHVKAVKTGLNLLPGTRVIPFSAQTKQGREEIWALAEELLFGPKEDQTEGES